MQCTRIKINMKLVILLSIQSLMIFSFFFFALSSNVFTALCYWSVICAKLSGKSLIFLKKISKQQNA